MDDLAQFDAVLHVRLERKNPAPAREGVDAAMDLIRKNLPVRHIKLNTSA
jgi:hypothetical protein